MAKPKRPCSNSPHCAAVVSAAEVNRTDAAPTALASWRDSDAKDAIVDFVANVTREDSPHFVPPSERIAVFDNDGTLWPENPMPFQLAFTMDELKRRLPDEPSWNDDPAVQSALGGNLAALLADHYKGLFRLIQLTGSGMTTVEFADRVRAWFATAEHPRFKRPYDQLAYQPMVELLAYLRAHGFKTFLVSGGGADFMRVFSERVYGVPPEQVVGSNARTVYELRENGPVLVKTPDALFVDDKAGKPVGIHQFIGRRPIACFGNSDGDKEMLEYTTINNPRPSLGLIVHHTDAEREYAYDKDAKSSGKLVAALADAPKRGWIVVDMAKDWVEIFTP
ncbi:MAG: haloacid dehalogenase-like hydrolase [Chthoniobacterales bacterium]|nr:haloacid dehalogenase-like hydrolase [Chthoniobacterales bacterium]